MSSVDVIDLVAPAHASSVSALCMFTTDPWKAPPARAMGTDG